jgi:tetratricopeptide (TPR) repeat protein
MSKWKEAAQSFKKFCELYPEDNRVNDAWLEVSFAYRKQEKFNEAVELLYGLFHKLGEGDETLVERALRALVELGDIYRKRGDNSRKRNDINQMCEELEKAVEIYKECVRIAKGREEWEEWIGAIERWIAKVEQFLKEREEKGEGG